MSGETKGTLVVGLRQENLKVERLKDDISSIPGVSIVSFNYLTYKLTVAHDGTSETISRIEKLLEGLKRIDS